MKFLDRVKAGGVTFDGGFGTMVQDKMEMGELPEMLNLRMPEAVTEVHIKYLEAGADVIETNTLNANRRKLAKVGKTPEEVIAAALSNAKKAVSEVEKEAYIALSMGPTGMMIEPLGDLSFDEAVDMYSQMALAGEKNGADLILIETMSDLHEVKAAVIGAKKTSLPVAVTLTFMGNGRLLTGADVRTAVCALEGFGVDIIGMNCGLGPDQMASLMDEYALRATKPILINPNAGLPKTVNGLTTYEVSPGDFAVGALKLAEAGAELIGGCCGTTPEHIKALREMTDGIRRKKTGESPIKGITSGSKLCVFGDECVITDITADDDDDMVDNAMDAEGDALLINGADDITESTAYLQETVMKPLCLFDEDASALEKAAARVNGRALIGVANAENVGEYARAAKNSLSALAVCREAYETAAAQLGEDNVYIFSDGKLYCHDGGTAAVFEN